MSATDGSGGLDLPPLLCDVAVTADVDPFAAAIEAAEAGVDGGTLFWALRDDRLEAALVLAPEAPLRRAQTVIFSLQQALIDALGALGPPELAAYWSWPDVFLLNEARAGRMRLAAANVDPDQTPNWLVVGLSLRRTPRDAEDPGHRPDETCLYEEGCGDLSTRALAAAWARHALYWISSWEADGLGPTLREWRGRATGEGGRVSITLGPEAPLAGDWLGLDEEGALLVKTQAGPVRLTLDRMRQPDFAQPERDPLDRAAALTTDAERAPMGGEALRRR